MERLEKLVKQFDPSIDIAAKLGSVKDSIAWLSKHPSPQLIIADIQLSDGLSHEVFESKEVQCPVIFVTAFDHHLVKVLEFHCIDYVLKPVKAERLHAALKKYLKLRSHFMGNLGGFAASQSQKTAEGPIERLLVKKGIDMHSLPVTDIGWFYSELKVTFALDTAGVRYIVDRSLTELMEGLAADQFFRLNRKYIARITAVSSVKPCGKGKLCVQLMPKANEEVQVSQENAGSFRKWLGA